MLNPHGMRGKEHCLHTPAHVAASFQSFLRVPTSVPTCHLAGPCHPSRPAKMSLAQRSCLPGRRRDPFVHIGNSSSASSLVHDLCLNLCVTPPPHTHMGWGLLEGRQAPVSAE